VCRKTGVATIVGWEMAEAGMPLRRVSRPAPSLSPDDVLIEVAGCGVCHTDLGFLHGGVRPRHALPLILGHEISGYVEEAGARHAALVGRAVVVPAVLPCGECGLCRSGRSTICRSQIMPGNDRDGGFATHVTLPGRFVCPVPGAGEDPDAPIRAPGGPTLRHLAVVADAVSTAYQAVQRSGLGPGGLAVVVGLGGVGTFAAQLAAEAGAAVVGLDVDPRRLAAASRLRAGLALDPRTLPGKQLRAEIADFARKAGAPDNGWTILECSGTVAGQQTAWSLIGYGATVVVIGFTLEATSLRLSNLMAFDARAIGNWGCAPELYPALLDKVLSGRIDVVSHTALRPLADVAAVLEEVRAHRVDRRVVLVPGKEQV
jgi:6-hydroxycyclohex-1-ene-1-carbonyl-CoA dehydrogenase